MMVACWLFLVLVGFLFGSDGRKLVVYADGTIKLCNHNDELLNDNNEKEKLWMRIRDYVTVTECI